MDISPCAIGRFLFGMKYQALINSGEMNYCMEQMRKITKKTLGSDEKMKFFW